MIPANSKRNNPTNSGGKNAVPKRRRAGLADLSNAITSNLRISENGKKTEKVVCSLRARSEESSAFATNEEREKKARSEVDDVSYIAERIIQGIRAANVKSVGIGSAVKSTDLKKEKEWEQGSNSTVDDQKDENEEGWVDPCPEFDYDSNYFDDPFQVAEYAADIFKYYRYRELKFRASDYLSRHPALKKIHRAKIVDWFVRCQEDFEVNHEVLYHSVKIFDLYLCRCANKEEFNYVGAAAMIVASKADHQDSLAADDFPDLTSPLRCGMVNEYERKIMKALNYDINFPLSYSFLRRFSRAGGVSMQKLTLARYILETSLLFYEFICVPDSLMAAAALLLALSMSEDREEWSARLEKYSGYTAKKLEPLMWRLNHMMRMRTKVYPSCKSIELKYSHKEFFYSSDVQLLRDRRPRDEPVGPPRGLDFASQIFI